MSGDLIGSLEYKYGFTPPKIMKTPHRRAAGAQEQGGITEQSHTTST